jgi:uncharacterized protein YggT (Ycf19 family)
MDNFLLCDSCGCLFFPFILLACLKILLHLFLIYIIQLIKYFFMNWRVTSHYCIELKNKITACNTPPIAMLHNTPPIAMLNNTARKYT